MTIAGSINQSGSSVSGAVHVDSSNCFDHLTTINLTGVLAGSNISLTSMSVGGQVITLTGSTAGDAFTGTYTVNGGCGDGDHGNVTGIRVPLIAAQWNGAFTTSEGGTLDVVAELAQSSAADAEGSFGITGTVAFPTSCFRSGTITSGKFPTGSFVIGTSVALVIETGNGTLTFVGTENLAKSEISGAYAVSGGTCDQIGTGVLVANPWGY